MGKKKPRQQPETLNMPSGGVETHAHLDAEAFGDELEAVVARARDCGVDVIGQVFMGPEAFAAGRPVFDRLPGIFYLLGVHPHEAKDLSEATLDAMRAAFADCDRLKAVGETGLDFFYDKSPRAVQVRAFRDQLALARELDKPVVVHSRDAFQETLDALLDMGFSERPLLWHCFGGDKAMMRAIVDNGWHLSIPGPVTYKKNEAAQRAVASAPLDRLVLETDCPYLSPEPWRGKRNEPAYLGFTAAKVAELRGMDVAELWHATADNARRFFHLD